MPWFKNKHSMVKRGTQPIALYFSYFQLFTNMNIQKKEITNTYQKIKDLIKKTRSICILIHHNPDGDAVGSALALYHFFRQHNHKVHIITPNDYPGFLQWLPGNKVVIDFNKQQTKAIDAIVKTDILLGVDFNEVSRIKDLQSYWQKSTAKKIIIDHHPNPQDNADLIISDTSASSAAELVYNFMEYVNKDAINKTIAECVYTGIMCDTGNFNFNSSHPHTFRLVADLLTFGINKDYIFDCVYHNFSENRMRLLGYCLSEKLVVLPEYRTAYLSINLKEQQTYHFRRGDSEGLVNYPLSIKNIVFSVLFFQTDKEIRISFRSKGNFNVNCLARKYFNGGGHDNAAGGNSNLNMDATIRYFTNTIQNYKNQLQDVNL